MASLNDFQPANQERNKFIYDLISFINLSATFAFIFSILSFTMRLLTGKSSMC